MGEVLSAGRRSRLFEAITVASVIGAGAVMAIRGVDRGLWLPVVSFGLIVPLFIVTTEASDRLEDVLPLGAPVYWAAVGTATLVFALGVAYLLAGYNTVGAVAHLILGGIFVVVLRRSRDQQ